MALLKPILDHYQQLALIIAPNPLQQNKFSHFHAGPTCSHMSKYKTLYRMKLRILWPGLRIYVTAWVKGCAHCLSYNVWRNRRQELHFSWPVTISFYIMDVDLWDSGTYFSKNSAGRHLLNFMCDLMQLVAYNITTETHVEHLANLFMENIALSFGMVAILVVNAIFRFKSVFKDMCTALGIIYWPLSHGNHKGKSIEKYHRFLRKRQEIASQDRGTHDVFLHNYKTSHFAWNNAPIDGTDILRSVTAIDRELRFLLDV